MKIRKSLREPHALERMRLTQRSLDGEAVRIGIAYRLKSGEIVCVPEVESEPVARAPDGIP